MKFEDALQELRKGKKIRHSSWLIDFYLSLKGDYLNNFPCTEYLISDDWEILEETGKPFPEVFEAFKEGKNISRKERNRIFNNKSQGLYLHAEDLLATDWLVLEE